MGVYVPLIMISGSSDLIPFIVKLAKKLGIDIFQDHLKIKTIDLILFFFKLDKENFYQ